MSSKSSKKNKPAGEIGESRTNRLIEIGRIVGVHGLRGEARVTPYSSPCPTLRPGLQVELHTPQAVQYTLEIVNVRTVSNARRKTPSLLLAFAGIHSRSRAESLRGALLFVDETALPELRAGEFYHNQLIGLSVQTATDERVGDIYTITTTPAHDLLVVRNGKTEYLIPVVEDVIQSIDLSDRRVIIDPPPGLLESAGALSE